MALALLAVISDLAFHCLFLSLSLLLVLSPSLSMAFCSSREKSFSRMYSWKIRSAKSKTKLQHLTIQQLAIQHLTVLYFSARITLERRTRASSMLDLQVHFGIPCACPKTTATLPIATHSIRARTVRLQPHEAPASVLYEEEPSPRARQRHRDAESGRGIGMQSQAEA